MAADDAFLSRVKLLIIMTKAYLNGYPLGRFREAAFIDNARFVFYEALCRSPHKRSVAAKKAADKSNTADWQQDHLFFQCAQLLAVMAKSIAEDNNVNGYRKQAIVDNVNHMSNYFSDQFNVADVRFLRVA